MLETEPGRKKDCSLPTLAVVQPTFYRLNDGTFTRRKRGKEKVASTEGRSPAPWTTRDQGAGPCGPPASGLDRGRARVPGGGACARAASTAVPLFGSAGMWAGEVLQRYQPPACRQDFP